MVRDTGPVRSLCRYCTDTARLIVSGEVDGLGRMKFVGGEERSWRNCGCIYESENVVRGERYRKREDGVFLPWVLNSTQTSECAI